MSQLGKIADSVDAYNRFVAAEVARARTDHEYAAELRAQWQAIRAAVDWTQSPTGTPTRTASIPAAACS